MKSEHIPGILKLFGSLVTYEKTEQLGWLPKLCNTMPAMIVCFGWGFYTVDGMARCGRPVDWENHGYRLHQTCGLFKEET